MYSRISIGVLNNVRMDAIEESLISHEEYNDLVFWSSDFGCYNRNTYDHNIEPLESSILSNHIISFCNGKKGQVGHNES